MVDKHHRIKGEMVTTMEKPERPMESWSLLIRTTVAFDLYYFSKIDEVHIILDIYMDKVGIPMLVTMSQYKMGIQAQIMGADQYIYTIGST